MIAKNKFRKVLEGYQTILSDPKPSSLLSNNISIRGLFEDYETEFGVTSMDEHKSTKNFFYKVKLKNPPQIPFLYRFIPFALVNDYSKEIRFQYPTITHYSYQIFGTDKKVLQDLEGLSKDYIISALKALTSLARGIESGANNIVQDKLREDLSQTKRNLIIVALMLAVIALSAYFFVFYY